MLYYILYYHLSSVVKLECLKPNTYYSILVFYETMKRAGHHSNMIIIIPNNI